IEAAGDRRDEAIKAYEQVLKLQPRPLAAALGLSRLYLTSGNASKATTYSQQALAMQPDNPEARSLLVRSKLMAGDLRAATEEMVALQKAFPDAVGVAKLSALVELASKKPEAARVSYERILKTAPRDVEALAGLIRIDVAAGHANAAVARID